MKSPRITIDCFDDDSGEAIDRYTVVICGLQTVDGVPYATFLGASANPFHPQGIGQHSHEIPVSDYHVSQYSHLGKRVTFTDLPEDVQKFVAQEFIPY